MSQIARRRRKGRPSKADLAARRSSSSPGESGYELRRGQRQRNVRYNFDFDDYFDEEEEDDVEEEKKRQKKLKQVLKLNQSRARADPPIKSRARVRHASDYEEEEDDEDDDEAEEEDEEDVSEKRQVKKRKINRHDDEDEEEEKDYDVEEEEEDQADTEEDDDDKERKRRSASGTQCDHSSETTPILDKKSLELILDKLQKKDIYGVYAEPVDPEELPDYHEMIEHPMDFSTVRKKLANGSYSTLEELESDVLLICSNAMQYNSSDTVYYKQARTIQEMGKRKFDKARIKIKRAEKELKTDEKVKPGSSVKKQVRQPFSRNGLEPVGSDFSFGANLASGGASQNEPVLTQTGGHEKHSCSDVFFEGNASLVDNLEKAEDLSSGKGLVGKCGRKLSVVEEDRRATYENSDQQADRSESIFTTFESEIKQFVAVGLHAEHAYGRSLARFAATLGPVAWKIASQRIEQALPADFKFGRGWVGEYEPLPTPVLLFETYTPKEPPKEASVFSKPKSNAAAKKNETLFKTPLPVKEQQGNRPVRDGNRAFPFPTSIGASLEGSPSFVATQVGNLKSMSQHEYRNPSPLDFVKSQNRIPQQVELNLPPPAEQSNSGSTCVSENRSFGKSDTVASYRSSSACTIDKPDRKEVIVFGGFGGFGRHARRNESLLLDPSCGTLRLIAVNESPSARLGHTASMVGDFMFVIGGRADPLNILNDVWRLDISKGEWSSQRCIGSEFPPRHRHAAASVGTKVYIFGGLYNDKIVSSLHILDTKDLQWKEVEQQGQWPCARHSHAMVAYGSQLFMFGGYNGENVLNDLYSFDVQSCSWKLEVISGKWPHARFSHSMFVYKHIIGIIGGCPVSQNCQELTLLDLKHRLWRSVRLEFMNKELFVRSTASVLGDDLIVIGGGAACYAFGTKFSEPVKINLVQSVTMSENNVPLQPEDVSVESNKNDADLKTEMSLSQPWVIQLERKYAKFGKDILKSFGWLDLERKVYSNEKGLCICFPVTEKFSELFHEKQLLGKDLEKSEDDSLEKGLSIKDISSSAALNLLKEHGAKKLINVAFEAKKVAKSPLQRMREDITSILKQKGLPEELLDELPQKWERLGDIVVLPATSFKDPTWSSISDEVWCAVSKSLSANRLARQGRVEPNGTRDSTLEILVGDNGWVYHRENGILYSFDATKCMFSWGNLSEKLRMGNMACENEVVVDLFAGIGYFVLPFLVRAKARLVYACEWNPHAIEALRRNVEANSVSDRCIILEGDNRITAPKGVADRVNLGLIPSSEGSWVTAIQALRPEGGILHVHGNVKDSDESSWGEHVTKTLSDIARAEGRSWEVTVEHIEKVKWYAPRIRHLVADVRCR